MRATLFVRLLVCLYMRFNKSHIQVALQIVAALAILTRCAENPDFPAAGPEKLPFVTPSPTATSVPTVRSNSEEQNFLSLINEYRAQYNLAPLEISPELTAAARWMSLDMANNNRFSHDDSLGRDPFTRMAAFGYEAAAMAENIAAGNATATETFLQWKNSPGHNANMLGGNYRYLGVARAQNAASAYEWYWTTDFASAKD